MLSLHSKQDDLRRLKRHEESLGSELQAAQQQVHNLKASLTDTEDSSTTRARITQAELLEQQQVVSRLQGQLRQAQTQVQELTVELAARRREVQLCQEDLDLSEGRLQAREGQLQAVQSDLQACQKQLQTYHRELQACQADLQVQDRRSMAEREEGLQEVALLREDLDKMHLELQNARQAGMDAAVRGNQLEGLVKQLQQEVQDAQSAQAQAQSEAAQLQANLERSAQKDQALRQELQELHNAQAVTEQLRAEATARLHASQEEVLQLQREADDLHGARVALMEQTLKQQARLKDAEDAAQYFRVALLAKNAQAGAARQEVAEAASHWAAPLTSPRVRSTSAVRGLAHRTAAVALAAMPPDSSEVSRSSSALGGWPVAALNSRAQKAGVSPSGRKGAVTAALYIRAKKVTQREDSDEDGNEDDDEAGVRRLRRQQVLVKMHNVLRIQSTPSPTRQGQARR